MTSTGNGFPPHGSQGSLRRGFLPLCFLGLSPHYSVQFLVGLSHRGVVKFREAELGRHARLCVHTVSYVQGVGERTELDIDSVLNARAILVIGWSVGWRVGG